MKRRVRFIGISRVTGSVYAELVEFRPNLEVARYVLPLNGSYHKVSTIALSLLNCSSYLPIPIHVISVIRHRNCRHKGGADESVTYAILVPKKQPVI